MFSLLVEQYLFLNLWPEWAKEGIFLLQGIVSFQINRRCICEIDTLVMNTVPRRRIDGQEFGKSAPERLDHFLQRDCRIWALRHGSGPLCYSDSVIGLLTFFHACSTFRRLDQCINVAQSSGWNIHQNYYSDSVVACVHELHDVTV